MSACLAVIAKQCLPVGAKQDELPLLGKQANDLSDILLYLLSVNKQRL